MVMKTQTCLNVSKKNKTLKAISGFEYFLTFILLEQKKPRMPDIHLFNMDVLPSLCNITLLSNTTIYFLSF